MKIIILGAGQVGGTLAENLSSEENDITVVDRFLPVCATSGKTGYSYGYGMASFPTALKQAGADDADMLVAVTNSDEVNMVPARCTPCSRLGKIARIRQAAYLTRTGLFTITPFPLTSDQPRAGGHHPYQAPDRTSRCLAGTGLLQWPLADRRRESLLRWATGQPGAAHYS